MIGAASSGPKPKRVIGGIGVALAAFNGVVGMGIFALPGLVTGIAGPAAILAYALCLLVLALVGLCISEAGSRVESSGGIYAYIGTAFGPLVGGVAGMIAFLANGLASSAALARFFLDEIGDVLPNFWSPVSSYALLATMLGLLALANVRGARQGVMLTVVASGVKLAPLVLLAAVGLSRLDPHAVRIGMPSSPESLEQATLLLFFAFTGLEGATYLSGEVRDPSRTVPRALLCAIALVGLLYLALQVVAQNALGTSLAGSHQPLADAAHLLLGPWGGRLLLAATLLSVAGHIVADGLCSPRLLYALAERNQLPRQLAAVHPRFHTPAVAILVYPALVLLIAASGTFRQIAVISTTGTLLLYLLTCLGVLRLRAKGIAQSGKPFIVPGGATVPLLASALIATLLVAGATWLSLIATTIAVLAIGLAFGSRRLLANGTQRARPHPPGQWIDTIPIPPDHTRADHRGRRPEEPAEGPRTTP